MVERARWIPRKRDKAFAHIKNSEIYTFASNL